MRAYLCLLIVLGCLACTPPRPVPVIPKLSTWDADTLTVCCDRDANDPDCTPEHWAQIIHQHCRGPAKSMGEAGSSGSQCIRYSCKGSVQPALSNGCSPALHRRVKVHAVIDPTYKAMIGWKETLDRAVSHANWAFQPFGISFEITEVTDATLASASKSLDDAVFEALRRQKEGSKADLHLGLLRKDFRGQYWWQTTLGMSFYLAEFLVLNAREPADFPATFAHELGHTFGVEHSYVTSSLMRAKTMESSWKATFDKASAQIIQITKCVDLKKGINDLSDSQLRQISDIFGAAYQKEDLNPLVSILARIARKALGSHDDASAIAAAKRAVLLEPYHPYPHSLLGSVYLRLKRYNDSLKSYETAVEKSAEIRQLKKSRAFPAVLDISLRGDALTGLGDAHYHLDQLDRAESLYRHVLKEVPRYPGGYSGMGWIAIRSNRLDDAKQWFEKSLEIDPDWEDSKIGLTKIEKASKPKG